MTGTNFVWLVFDSLRGDRTSIGGHDRETTPTLAAMGAGPDGVADTCFAHGIWSQPSVASMMTGTYLSTHGSGSYNEVLPAGIPTVPERLSEAGYRTVGVSANPYFSATTGTDRGFDRFDFVSGTDLLQEAGFGSVASFLWNLRTFSGGFTLDKQRHTPDFLLNEIVKERLRTATARESPFFLTAHYYGLHHPYYPSPAFRGQFAEDLPMDPGRAAELAFDRSKDVYQRIAEAGAWDGAEKAAIDAMYDAQVRQVDALVDRLLGYIDRLGIGEDTIVVVTSDHGDLLGEQDLVSHKLLVHDALIEVPLAVRGSELLADADLELAQHADVMETILTELGADVEGMQGTQLNERARDLAVAQRGPETYRKTIDEVRTHNPDFELDTAFGGFVTALRTPEWKYVSGDNERALYRLPVENEDVSASHPEVVERFETRLAEWQETHSTDLQSGERAEFDEDVKRHLADLGYVVD